MGSERRRSTGAIMAAVLGGILVLAAGFLIGRMLVAEQPAALIEPGTIVEARLSSGDVMIGAYAGSSDGFLILTAPAGSTTESNDESSQRTIHALSAPPSSIAGNILIGQDQIVVVGAVAPGSDVETRYYEAIGVTPPTPSSDPSP